MGTSQEYRQDSELGVACSIVMSGKHVPKINLEYE